MSVEKKTADTSPQKNVPTANLTILLREDTDEIGKAARNGFLENGCQVSQLIATQDYSGKDFLNSDYLMMAGPMKTMAKTLKRFRQIGKDLPPIVVWYTEQISNPKYPLVLTSILAKARVEIEQRIQDEKEKFPGGRLRALGEMLALKDLGVLKMVATFTQSNALFMRQFGLPAVYHPIGYYSELGENLHFSTREIDLTFLGSTRDRRRGPIIKRLEAEMERAGIIFRIVDGSPSRDEIYGQERTELLNNSSLYLNVMRQPWDNPVFRVLTAAANGAVALSEMVGNQSTGPFKPGEHFITTPLGEITKTAQEHLARPKELREMAENTHNFVMSELTMPQQTARLLQLLANK